MIMRIAIDLIQLSNRRKRFQQVSLYIEVLLVQPNNWTLSHTHQDHCARAWCRDYSRAGFVQLEQDDKCGKNSRVGRIQGNTVHTIPGQGSINIATLLCSYAHCTPSTVIPEEVGHDTHLGCSHMTLVYTSCWYTFRRMQFARVADS